MKQFNTDCEGPISKNDNAFELSKNFIHNGDIFFTQISRYDDFLTDIIHMPNYKAGDTLKLILPFLKAYDVTDEKIEEYSKSNILLLPNAKQTLQYASKKLPSFIISTSYSPYISALCKLTNFPFENTYSTKVSIDKFTIPNSEIKKLKNIAIKIIKMPLIDLNDLNRSKETIKKLSNIFWKEMPKMKSNEFLISVNPIGGYEKAEAIKHSLKRTGNKLSDVLYVGDSITDVEAFDLVKRNNGLTVSFNGNEYAVKNAEIAIISDSTSIISIIINIFSDYSKEKVIEFIKDWKNNINKIKLDNTLDLNISNTDIKLITHENKEQLAKESSLFRKTVRGEKIAELG